MTICNYPSCTNEIRKEDYDLKPHTAKLCEEHNQELVRLSDDTDDVSGLVSFMTKVAFKGFR